MTDLTTAVAEGLGLNERLRDPSLSSEGPDANGGRSISGAPAPSPVLGDTATRSVLGGTAFELSSATADLPPAPDLAAVLGASTPSSECPPSSVQYSQLSSLDSQLSTLDSQHSTLDSHLSSLDSLLSPASSVLSPSKDLFSKHERSAWNEAHIEARCDFTFKPRITRRSDLWFLSVWQKSLMGRTLTDIKGDDEMIPFFAQEVGALMAEVLGDHLHEGGYALVTSPKRRHKERNFATLICLDMAAKLGIPFYEDAAFCTSRQRLGAVFEPGNIPSEPNVIVFDDFVTTGQTLRGMADLLLKYGKNITFFTGINNKL